MAVDFRSARFWAKEMIENALFDGACAVDATMGNGHDTQWLCELVGENGRVYAFDVQAEAVERTKERVKEAGYDGRATLLLAGHETMAEHVKEPVQAVMFNLGWLPGAEHIVTTKTETTLAAVRAACNLIAPGGIVTVCVYPGHEEGTRELSALLEYAASLDVRRFNVAHHRFLNASLQTPQLILIQKNK